MWRVFSALQEMSLWGRFEDLIAVVVLIVGAFGFWAVVRAARRALVVWSRFGSPVWSSVGRRNGRSGPGLVVWSRPTPLALIVRLLRVGLPLHPPLLHWTVAARVVVFGACRAPRAVCRAPRAACLTARAVPTSIWFAVRRNALPVAALVIRPWTAFSLVSVWEKVNSFTNAVSACFSGNSHFKVFKLLPVFSYFQSILIWRGLRRGDDSLRLDLSFERRWQTLRLGLKMRKMLHF